jgi:hypothetical protein
VPSAFADVWASLARAFALAGASWYVFGAQAALLYGVARFTADVDVTARLPNDDTSILARALLESGFALRVEDEGFVQRTRVLPVVHVATGIPVDIVLAGPGIEEAFLERAEMRDLEGVRVPVARPEDVAAMKILAGRPKDIDDVVAILAARTGGFDLALLRRTLQTLEEALGQSDLSSALEEALARASGQRPKGERARAKTTPKRRRSPRR